MSLRQAAQRALKAMEDGEDRADMIEFSDALIALRAALAEPEQEPVAWRYRGNLHEFDPSDWAEGPVTPLYTASTPRKPLSDEEIGKLPWGPHEGNPMTFAEGLRDFARAVERAHGIGEQT